MAYQLTDEAKALLLEVAERIEAEPQRFDMDTYYETINGSWEHPCNTTACIAGHIGYIMQERGECAVYPGNDTVRIGGVYGERVEIGKYAAKVIGVPIVDFNMSNATHPLFFSEEWEEEYRVAYVDAETDAERAQIAAARIRHFVETGE